MTNYSTSAGSIIGPASYITFYENLMEYPAIIPVLMLVNRIGGNIL